MLHELRDFRGTEVPVAIQHPADDVDVTSLAGSNRLGVAAMARDVAGAGEPAEAQTLEVVDEEVAEPRMFKVVARTQDGAVGEEAGVAFEQRLHLVGDVAVTGVELVVLGSLRIA